jgi:hypothetical protein
MLRSTEYQVVPYLLRCKLLPMLSVLRVLQIQSTSSGILTALLRGLSALISLPLKSLASFAVSVLRSTENFLGNAIRDVSNTSNKALLATELHDWQWLSKIRIHLVVECHLMNRNSGLLLFTKSVGRAVELANC